MIENKTITLDDGLSFATNQNNLLLQLRGLASTEDFLNAVPKSKIQTKPVAAPPPPSPTPNSANSVLNMIE
jgi:hypothetical protein